MLEQGHIEELSQACGKHHAQLAAEWPEWVAELLALQGDPDRKKAAHYAAKMLVVAEIVEESLNDSRLVQIFHPSVRTPDPAVRLGNLYLALDRYPEAEVEYRTILSRDLNHQAALRGLGRMRQTLGSHRDAILCFNKLLSLDPGDTQAAESLGELYMAEGMTTQAVEMFLFAAEIQMSVNHRQEAVRLYQRVVELDPGQAVARKALSVLLKKTVQEGGQHPPELRSAKQMQPGEFGTFTWDCSRNTGDLEYTDQGRRATWKQREPGGIGPRLWVPVQSLARLHSGVFRWEFHIAGMGGAQIGVGVMLDWSVGPDWGFYGYLGSSSSAWAYDPSTGDVVYDTRSIEGGLPILTKGRGIVSVEAHLPREEAGKFRFWVGDRASRFVELPPGSVIVPAACFLEVGQSVALTGFETR